MADMLNEETYLACWRNVAKSNANIYDELDGVSSVYKCKTLAQFISGLQAHNYFTTQDPRTRELTNQIQGFLITWPLDFLIREDTTPSVAMKAVVPTDLWV